jgi:hypothetical protein
MPTDALKDSHCATRRAPVRLEFKVNITSIPIVSTPPDPYSQCARTHHTVVAVSAATSRCTARVLLRGGRSARPHHVHRATNLSDIRVEDQ